MAGNEIATAYLTLVPTLKGAQASITKQLSGVDTSAAGSKLGDTAATGFGSGFSKVAKTIAGVFAAKEVVQAVGGLAKTALDAFAENEQLAGGVEKIFDDMDNSVIFADAAEAYKTLNLSANEYLATINDVGANFASTMGDQAGYETAKKGLTAISDYASGTGKNLDNLKEKFGLITRSTSSYQSIADQFSGVLPATSAGFLETAQAAGYLDKSYEKLTQVPIDEYQAAVAAMLEKGVADLGLAGNTAAETANTVSGSLAAVSGAWANWLAGLANENADVSLLTDQLIESVTTAAGLIVPRIGDIFTSLGSTLHERIPVLLDSLIAKVRENGVGMGEAALEMLGSIASAIASYAPQILAALGLMLASLVVAIVNKGIEFFNAAVDVMSEMASGIADGATFVLSELERGVTEGVEKVKGMASDFIQAGKDLIQGLVDGIGDAKDWVIEKINEVCSNALDAVKNFFGIHSPSKVMAEMGSFISQGLANGITSKGAAVKQAMKDVSDETIATIKSLVNATDEQIGNMALSVQSLGTTMDAFAQKIEGVVSSVSDGFSRMSRDSQLSLQEWKYNLYNNIREAEYYTANLEKLFSKVGSSVDTAAFRQAVYEGGYSQYGQLVADLARSSVEDIANTIKLYNKAVATGQTSAVSQLGATTSNQTIIFNQPVKSAAETARALRLQNTYGLAGAR